MKANINKQNHKIVVELIRFFSGAVLSSFLLFVLRDLDANPNINENLFNWIGTISVIGFMVSFIAGIIVLERKEISKINYKDRRIYIYALLLLGIEYVLLPLVL